MLAFENFANLRVFYSKLFPSLFFGKQKSWKINGMRNCALNSFAASLNSFVSLARILFLFKQQGLKKGGGMKKIFRTVETQNIQMSNVQKIAFSKCSYYKCACSFFCAIASELRTVMWNELLFFKLSASIFFYNANFSVPQ